MVFIADNNNLIPLFVMFRYNFMYLCHKSEDRLHLNKTFSRKHESSVFGLHYLCPTID